MKRKKIVKSNMGKQHDQKAMMRLADGGIVDGLPRKTPEQISLEAGFPTGGQQQPYAESNRPLPAVPAQSPKTFGEIATLRPRPPDPPTTSRLPQWMSNGFADVMGVERIPASAPPSQRPMVAGMKDGGPVSLKGALRHGELHYGKGEVEGPGGPTEDKVPAMLSNGEYVIPADVVKQVGKHHFDDLVNEYHEHGESDASLRHFAGGVYVDPTKIPNIIPGENVPVQPVYPPNEIAGENVPSPQEPSLRAPTSGPAPTSAVEHAAVQAQPNGKLHAAGRFAGNAARIAGNVARPIAVAAPLTGFGDYKINDPGVDSSAGGTIMNGVRRVRDMFRGNAMTEDRTAGQEGLKKGAVEAGLDSASGVAKTADWAAGIVGANPDLSGRLRRNVEGDLGTAVQPQPVAAPQQVTPNVQTGAIPSEPTINEAPAEQPVDDATLRANAADQRAVAARYNEARGRALDPRYQAAQANNDARIDNARYHTDADMASLRAGVNAPAEGTFSAFFADRNARKIAAQQAELGQRERESLRTANVQLTGQQMTAATARNMARIEQMNKDRAYGLDREKFNVEKTKAFGTDGTGTGGEVGRAEAKRQEDAVKAKHEQITTMIPPVPDKDGKMVPDTATAQRYVTGLNVVVGNAIKNAEKYVAANPNDAVAARKLARLKSEGVGALDEADVRRHVSGMQTADIAQREHSNMNPFKGSAPQTSAPVVSMKHKPGTISDDYEVVYGDGSKGTVPARAIDKSSDAIFGMGGQRRTDSDILKEPSLRR